MAYAHYASITVDNTKVSGSSNLSNFPVLVSGTYDGTGGEPDLRSAANGGNVENVDATAGNSGALNAPADLAFYDDDQQTTQYDHEVEFYDPATGKFVAHVRIPTLLYNSDTTFYMFYGDSAVTTSQENVNGVWDSNFKGVWHCNNAPSTIYDSTSSPLNMTTQGSMDSSDLVDGKVGKGLDFEADSAQFMKTATSPTKLNFTTQSYTLEGVVNLESVATDKEGVFFAHGDGTAYWQYYTQFIPALKLQFLSSGGGNITSTNAFSLSTDLYVVAVRDSTTGRIYFDGVANGTGTGFNNPSSRTDSVFHGNNNYPPSQRHIDGVTSELRISDVARSADWIATTHETIMNPSTFYTMGSEVGEGGGGGPTTFVSQQARRGRW